MRTQRIITNGLLLVVTLLFLSSCMTYKRFVRKFGHMAKDSTLITVRDTITIPKDSVQFSYVNDTIPFYKVIEGPRAKLKINRSAKSTSIQAECKPDTFRVEIPGKCPPVVSFGVAPWYKTGFFILIGLVVALLIAYVFLYHLKVVKR